jgi:hypothetical protein
MTTTAPRTLAPHPDRLFPADPATRTIARTVYEAVASAPIISPHGHVDAALIADDQPFADPASLLISCTRTVSDWRRWVAPTCPGTVRARRLARRGRRIAGAMPLSRPRQAAPSGGTWRSTGTTSSARPSGTGSRRSCTTSSG